MPAEGKEVMGNLIGVIFSVSVIWAFVCFIAYQVGYGNGMSGFSKALDRSDDEDRRENDMLNAIE